MPSAWPRRRCWLVGVLLAGQDDLVDVAKAGAADDGAMMNLLARASRTWSMVPSPGWTIGRLTTR